MLNRASTAAEKTKIANAKEKLQMELVNIQAEKLSKGEEINLTALEENEEYLSQKGIKIEDSETPRSVSIDGYIFKVNNDLTIAETTDITIANNRNDFSLLESLAKELIEKQNRKLTAGDLLSSDKFTNDLFQSESNIDYILNNPDKYLSLVINNKGALKLFANNSVAWNKIVSNSTWTTAILGSNTAIAALDEANPTTVPIMTSNTTPSGEAFASSSFETYDIYPYRVFDGATSGEDYWNPAANSSYKDQYIGYDFGTAIWVYKIVAYVSNGKQNTDYVIEGSNEKTTGYEIIKDGLHQSGTEDTIIPNNYNKKFRYYRLRMLSEIAQSGSGNTGVITLQFYGK